MCFELYKGRYLGDDLFSEFYLRMVSLSDEKIQRDISNLKRFCYNVIRNIYKERMRRSSPLNESKFEPIDDLSDEAEPYTEPVVINGKPVDEERYYAVVEALQKEVESQLQRPHGIVPMVVFTQSQNESLRSISRKSQIPVMSLSRYKRKAVEDLKNVANQHIKTC